MCINSFLWVTVKESIGDFIEIILTPHFYKLACCLREEERKCKRKREKTTCNICSPLSLLSSRTFLSVQSSSFFMLNQKKYRSSFVFFVTNNMQFILFPSSIFYGCELQWEICLSRIPWCDWRQVEIDVLIINLYSRSSVCRNNHHSISFLQRWILATETKNTTKWVYSSQNGRRYLGSPTMTKLFW